MTSIRKPKFPLLFVATLALATGCGKSDRFSVSGTVTLDDRPLAEGSLTLIPLSGGPTCGALIESGVFSINRERGPVGGKYRVQIESWVASGKTVQELDNEGAVMDRIQTIPERYNVNSELTIDVAPKQTNFTFRLATAE